MKIKQSLFATALLVSAAISSNAQDGTKFIGYDAKTLGRGGTATGFFNNNTVLQTNPAGMSFLKSSGFELGLSGIFPKAHFKNDINDADGKSNTYPMGTISFVCKPKGKFSYGAGIFTEGGAGADFSLNHKMYKDALGNYVKQSYHSKFMVLEGGASVAYKVNNTFSVGGTAQLVYSQLEFGAPLSLSPSLLKGVINPVTGYTFANMFGDAPTAGGLGYSELTASAQNNGLVAWGFSGKIGIAYKPNESFSFGLNYTSPTALNYKDGYANLDMTYQFNDAFGRAVAGAMAQNPGITQAQAQHAVLQKFAAVGINVQKGVVDRYFAKAKFILPQSIAGGASIAIGKKARIGLDAEWVNWANAFAALEINLSHGANSNINKFLGTNGTISFPFPLLWKDAVVIRTGGEYKINDSYTIRAGYMYGSNPIPTSTVFPVFPAVIEHHVTVGGSVKLTKLIDLNLAYEHGFNNTETASNTSLLGSQYNNSQTSLAVNVFHASISCKLK